MVKRVGMGTLLIAQILILSMAVQETADYAIRKYARETTTPGLLMYILMCVGMFRKKSRHWIWS